MINLLSDDKKAEIRAGRMNVILLRFITITGGGMVLLAFIVIGAYVTLRYTHDQVNTHVQQNATDEAAYQSTKTEAQTYRDNLSTAKDILNKGTNYSALIVKIANAVPSGVVLDSLSLSAETIGQPITLNAHARSLSAAKALKANFSKHPELFSNVSFNQIDNGSSGDSSGSSNDYPISITLALTINKAVLQK